MNRTYVWLVSGRKVQSCLAELRAVLIGVGSRKPTNEAGSHPVPWGPATWAFWAADPPPPSPDMGGARRRRVPPREYHLARA
jgi:hypothetical protein